MPFGRRRGSFELNLSPLKISGPTGPTQDKPFKSNEKAGTTRCTLVGPVDIEWSQPARATGPSGPTPRKYL